MEQRILELEKRITALEEMHQVRLSTEQDILTTLLKALKEHLTKNNAVSV